MLKMMLDKYVIYALMGGCRMRYHKQADCQYYAEASGEGIWEYE